MENKPRLYFSDPIAALYMMKEFGVDLQFKKPFDNRSGERFIDLADLWITDIDVTNHEEFRLLSILSSSEIPRIYIKPESEAIFNPQLKDKGIDPRGISAKYQQLVHNCKAWMPIEQISDDWIWEDEDIEITMRGKKHFFDALREENDNS